MKKRRLKPYIQILEGLDVRLLEVEVTGSSHYKMTVEARGRKRFFIVSYSPSDRRAVLNWKSDVRRWLSEEGNPAG